MAFKGLDKITGGCQEMAAMVLMSTPLLKLSGINIIATISWLTPLMTLLFHFTTYSFHPDFNILYLFQEHMLEF